MYRTDKPFLKDPVTACCRLRVSGLTKEVTPDDLEDIFSKYGRIVGMLVNPGLKYTFLQFEKEEQAIEAAEATKHGIFVRNSYLDVRRVPPSKDKHQPTTKADTLEVKKLQKHLGEWIECHDELTGYSYYWNTETDEVTWQTPTSFKPASKKDTLTPKDPPQHSQKTKSNLYVPPKTPVQPPGAVKIYSIGECSQQTFKIADSGGGADKKKKKTKQARDKDSVLKKFLGRDSESEDEKIELITSYGGDTDSEPEEPPPKKNKQDPQESDHNEDEDNDLDILSQIKKAQALKNVTESKKDISDNKKPKTVDKENNLDKQSKTVPGLKLVAGYSDSEEEEEEPHESIVVSKPTFAKPESHSTLFPITEPINIKDFASPKTETQEKAPTQAEFIDAKLFQRKKRIGVALINTGKKKEDVIEGDGERKGLGFSTGESHTSQSNSTVYPGFAKGGVMFVKTDVLEPSVPPELAADKFEKNNEEEIANKKLVKDMYQTLQEKLGFLNVGGGAVSPVYTMIIQSEILYNAMKEGGLKLSYLQKWLQNTCTELVNLEKEATPEGWLLQWDRKNKRYYYENLSTGVSQWDYPVEEEEEEEEEALPPQLPAPKPRSPPPPPLPASDDDAMDICTTPPPPDDLQEVATATPPPPPPVISCPSPPPPPIISRLEAGGDKVGQILLPGPAPPPPPSDTPLPGEISAMIEQQQPLPPGVDIPPPPPGEPLELPKEVQQPQLIVSPGDPLNSALNSFYSDIAALGSDLPTPTAPSTALPSQAAENPTKDQTVEGVKKKKKTKVKLAAGVTLKKKGVTQLVEKWNTLQNSYD